MNASGKTSSSEPWPAASAARSASLSIVASRSRITGSAWMHATVTGAFTAPIVSVQVQEQRVASFRQTVQPLVGHDVHPGLLRPRAARALRQEHERTAVG